jgi:hypothetical protein
MAGNILGLTEGASVNAGQLQHISSARQIELKKNRKAEAKMRKIKILLISAVLAGCSSPESFENSVDVAEVSQELMFNVNVQLTNGSSNETRLSQQGLWTCLKSYCGLIWDENKCSVISDDVLNSQCRNLANHNQSKCMADFLTQVSESADREVLWAAAKMPSHFWLINPSAKATRESFGAAIGTCIGKTVAENTLKDIAVVRFDYPQTLAHREELRDMAFKAYFKAVQGAVIVLNPPSATTPPPPQPGAPPPVYNPTLSVEAIRVALEARKSLYQEPRFEELFTDAVKPLTWKMASSLPSIVRKMTELKYANAGERQTKNTRSNDQWASLEYGALPVMWQFYGNVDDSSVSGAPTNLEDLGKMVLLAELLPRDPRPETKVGPDNKKPFLSPPPMTKALEAAIGFLAENEINIHAAMKGEGGVTNALNELLTRVNTARAQLDLAQYSSVTKMLAEKSLSKTDIEQAMIYMYVHLVVFPRLVKWSSSDINSHSSRFSGWNAPYISTPFGYYLSQMYSNHLQKNNGQWFDTIQFTGLTEQGLVPTLEYLEGHLAEATRIVAAGVHQGGTELEQDKKMLSSLKDTLKELERLLGRKRILYSFESSGTGVDNVRITLINPTISPDNSSKSQDEIAVYGINVSAANDIERLKGILCFSDETCRDSIRYKYFPKIGMCEATDAQGVLTGTYCKATNTIALANQHDGVPINLLWVVALRSSPEEKWQPVGFIDPSKVKKWSTPLRVGSIRIGSEVDTHVQSLISRDPKNITRTFCDPIGSGDECFDRDFVPAIDNEIVDPGGGQYEDSYRHYLSLAADAARKAKDLREQLIGDFIDKSHEGQVSQAQLLSAVDDYLRGIEEICGEQTRPDFDTLVSLAETSVTNKKNFGEVLESFMAKNVENGCLPVEDSSDGKPAATRKDPIHCYEPRDCDGATLGELGVAVPDIGVVQTYPQDHAGSGLGFGMSESCSKWVSDAVLDPSEVLAGECSKNAAALGAVPCAQEKLDRMICWIKRYRGFISSLLQNERIPHVPEVYKTDVNSQASNDISSTIDRGMQSKYGQGSYLRALSDMSLTVENLAGAADNYATILDSAIHMIEMIHVSIEANTKDADLQIAIQAASAALAEAAYNKTYDDEARRCVNDIRDKMNNEWSLDKFVSALKGVDKSFQKTKTNMWGDLNETNEFVAICQKAVNQASTMPLITATGIGAEEICGAIVDNWRGKATWTTDKKGAQYVCWDPNNKKKRECAIVGKKDPGNNDGHCSWDHMGGTRDNVRFERRCGPKFSLRCKYKSGELWNCDEVNRTKRLWFNIGDNKNSDNNCEGARPGLVCHPDDRYWFDLSDYWIEKELAGLVRSRLINAETRKCSSAGSGCEVSYDNEKDEFSISACGGANSDNLATHTSKWGEVGDLRKAMKESAFFKDKVQIADFSTKMVDLLGKLRESRHGVSNLIRTLNGNIATLNKLEIDQRNLFIDYLNKRNLAESATVTTLSEWKARHDFRRGKYFEQLRRARIAAWMARRAIEFRFGVDLARETTATNQGQAPAQWADDIYRAVGARCGEELSGADNDAAVRGSGNNLVEKCYSAENMVEEYVQKLEDYVLSYGNSRFDQWWLQDDDDVAVISLRDHVLFNERACTFGVDNFLHFTEELDMSWERARQVYGADSAALSEPVGTWEGTEDVIANVAALGLPEEIALEHEESKERKVFDDQEEYWTADLFIPSTEQSKLTQVVSMDWDISNGAPTGLGAAIQGKALQFSAYVRSGPVQTEQDCRANERYFPGVGRCGRSCHIEELQVGEDKWVLQHDCPGGMECVPAGGETDNDGNSIKQHMCVWCTADRSCMDQDGETILLGIQNGLASNQYTLAQRRASISSQWTKVVADTVTHYDKSQRIPEDSGAQVSVSIQPGQSHNLIPSSEELDPRYWLTIDTTGQAIISPNTALAPDGTMTADGIRTSPTRLAVQRVWTPIVYELMPSVPAGERFTFTISFWARTPTPGGLDIVVSLLEGGNNPKFWGNWGQTRNIGTEWERIEVIGQAFNVEGRRLGFQITIPADKELFIWGSQLEFGAGAGKYVPTGKNLLRTTDIMQELGLCSNVNYTAVPSVAPDGRKRGVVRMSAVQPNLSARGAFSTHNTGGFGGGSYTFSVWARCVDCTPQTVGIKVREWASGNPKPATEIVYGSLGSEWQRLTVAHMSSGSNSDLMTGEIELMATSGSARTGHVEIWGPQLEKGTVSTGYQSVNEPLEMFGHEASSPWSAGLVGLDLRPVDIMVCNGDGTLAGNTANNPQNCVMEASGYTRNTYLREHYSRHCELGSRAPDGYPGFEDIYPYVERQERVKIFSSSFRQRQSASGFAQTIVFPLSPESAQAGKATQNAVLAQGNFNYRIRTVFLNVVGTDVIDCSYSETPETCAANQWLSFDLKQMGEVRIRNHSLQDSLRTFKIPTGLIQAGKAWVAEQVIGYPVSGTHLGMVNQMSKTALRGRPLDGVFELTIHETPEVVWGNVEDIQLVIGYHYWTRSK